MVGLAWKMGSRVLLGLFMTAALALPAGAQQQLISTGSDKVAIKGYDTVAYFTEGQAVKGSSEFEILWQDARWHFSSAKNRDLFAADPERYAPQFGGLCSAGLAIGNVLVANPEVWTIAEGKLYLKASTRAVDQWRKNIAEIAKRAEENWAKLQQQ